MICYEHVLAIKQLQSLMETAKYADIFRQLWRRTPFVRHRLRGGAGGDTRGINGDRRRRQHEEGELSGGGGIGGEPVAGYHTNGTGAATVRVAISQQWEGEGYNDKLQHGTGKIPGLLSGKRLLTLQNHRASSGTLHCGAKQGRGGLCDIMSG